MSNKQQSFYYYWEPTLLPDVRVEDIVEKTHSKILGPDGKPILYKPQGMGYVGFIKLSVSASEPEASR